MKLSDRTQLIEQLNWRYATKQFDTQRKISTEDWATLEDSLVLTPSSFGLLPWRAITVTDPALREKLVGASYGQRQVADASHFVVFAVNTAFGQSDIDSFVGRVAEVRGAPVEALSGYRDMMINGIVNSMDASGRASWATQQAFIALGNLLTSAALLGIDACPMGGFSADNYDEILGLKSQNLHAVVICALGYRSEADRSAGLKKVRFSKDEVFLRY